MISFNDGVRVRGMPAPADNTRERRIAPPKPWPKRHVADLTQGVNNTLVLSQVLTPGVVATPDRTCRTSDRSVVLRSDPHGGESQ